MEIKRDQYLNELIDSRDNGMVKIVTGIRRSGKTFLLFNLFYQYLISQGISDFNIIKISLDEGSNMHLWDWDNFYNYLKSEINKRKDRCYILVDEIQLVKPKINKFTNDKVSFHFILIDLMKKADIYVTGSNSKMLSKDIVTEFRGRGTEIKINPLSFKEIYLFKNKPKDIKSLLSDYFSFGGMPAVQLESKNERKQKYLNDLFSLIYNKDILDKYHLKKSRYLLNDLLKFIASNIGSLTSVSNITNTFNSEYKTNVNFRTINKYLDILNDVLLIDKVEQFNLKGKRIIASSVKYYFIDIGLRNACFQFENLDWGHIMENIIYNEIIARGYNVKVGNIDVFGKDKNNKTVRKKYEIDFIAQKFDKQFYIQSSWKINSKEDMDREIRGFLEIKDNYKKILIVNDLEQFLNINSYNENGIHIVSLSNFLLDEDIFK